MRYWYDKRIKGIVCVPNSAEGWCQHIRDIAIDYDGYRTAAELMSLIDELADMAGNAIDCIYDGKNSEDDSIVIEEDRDSMIQARKDQKADDQFNS